MQNSSLSSIPILSMQQIALVQTSFGSVIPIADAAAELFYGKLFELDPTLRPLFKNDMKQQGRKLMLMLTIAVNGLNHVEKIVPELEELGRRHTAYAVEKRHYDTVGKALLWTLRQGLGAKFTQDVEEAWASAYALIAAVMKGACGNLLGTQR